MVTDVRINTKILDIVIIEGISVPQKFLAVRKTFSIPRGPQQAEILDAGAEIRAKILLEIRDPKSQAIFFPIISVKYGNYIT